MRSKIPSICKSMVIKGVVDSKYQKYYDFDTQTSVEKKLFQKIIM